MITNADDDPIVVKNLTRALRELPSVEPPGDLRGRILGSLPRRRGGWGRLEYTLKRDLFPHSPSGKTSFFLPSTPPEFGLALLSAGVFHFALGLAVIFGAPTSFLGILSVDSLFGIVPALIGSSLLCVGGLAQVRSPYAVVLQRARLAVAFSLFLLAALIGFHAGAQSGISIVAGVMGLSGLVVTTVGFCYSNHSRTTLEICREKAPCVA
ncbi:hypothetical protein [Desulfonatronum sp. SC1]|uniref:hypothetical protein n=1 Tax=Desulfonatronum sp. SC1 TaxID=2109626 RepID=UPI000D30E977|nr:hypothetical protein [Desulfonatronum sp. SC1]PTN37530.1 hypothetical protein C6366_06105 [Desulfonatronum sp. SC1]